MLFPQQVEYIAFLTICQSAEISQKQSNCKRPVKWSANRIETKAKQQEIANEVREKIIDHLIIPIGKT